MKKMDKQIIRHNESMQQLCRRYSMNFMDYLRSQAGSMFVTGGEKSRRRQVLLRQINWYRRTSNDSVVIFSSDPVLKAQLIEEAQAKKIGQLFIVDTEYCNYDFFYGMPLDLVSDYFSKAALLRGYRDTAKLLDYTDTVLDILEARDEVSLRTILQMLRNDDDDIAAAAASQEDSNLIKASLDGGANLRNLAKFSSKAFAPLTTADCRSRFNILSEIDHDCVILIDVPPKNHELFATYFATEIRSILQKSFKLIFDDEIMVGIKDLFEVIKSVKQRGNEVVLSFDNIMALQPAGEDILCNMPRQLMFLDGEMPAVDLQNVLDRFGDFSEMKAVMHEDTVPALIKAFRKGKGQAPLPIPKKRLLLQELDGIQALLAGGSSARITAVNQLIV